MKLASALPIGSVIHSMLTESQMQAEMGLGWILSDGRSVTGSVYATLTGNTVVPDMTGRFLRGKGANNPDGSLALGTYTTDKLGSHSHNFTYGTSNQASINAGGTIPQINSTGGNKSTDATGTNETAPKSITVNIFIRID